MRSEPILIAGGGIGGLAAALALARSGRDVTVLERSTEPTEAGAGIQLGPNAVKALRQLGVADAVAALASSPAALTIRRGDDGAILTRTLLGEDAQRRYGAPYWVVHRADLHRALFDATRASSHIAHRAGFEIATVALTSERVSLTATDGSTSDGTALIGADGVWSRVRATVMPGAEPTASGYIAYRTLISSADVGILAASEIGAWLTPSAHVVHYPVHNGTHINVVVIVRDTWQSPNWSAPADAHDIARAVAPFARPLQDALTKGSTWHKWSLAAPMHLNTWTRGRVALLGDAAHPVLPFLAQGGAMALEDAVQLGASMAAHPADIALAFIAYDRSRRARVTRVQTNASRNGRIFHLTGPMAAARDLALRTLPPTAVLSRLNWLYAFEPPRIGASRMSAKAQ